MSGKLMGQIYGLKLTPSKREILLAMAENADDDGGSCRPGVPYIAWKVDLSERQVQRIQKALIKDKILVVVATPVRKPVVYRIDISAGTAKEPFKTREQRKGDILSMNDGDNLSNSQGDILSENELRVTSHGNEDVAKGDIASADLASTHLKDEPLKDKKQQHARVFSLYEGLTGKEVENQIVADGLIDDANTYPAAWIEKATAEAAFNNAGNWKYVRKILNRWQLEGFPDDVQKSSLKSRASPQPPTPPILTPTSAGAPNLKERLNTEVQKRAGTN